MEVGGHELEAVGDGFPPSVEIWFQQEGVKLGRSVQSGDRDRWWERGC